MNFVFCIQNSILFRMSLVKIKLQLDSRMRRRRVEKRTAEFRRMKSLHVELLHRPGENRELQEIISEDLDQLNLNLKG